MALRLRDRVKQKTTTAGTGTLTLSSSLSSFSTFADRLSDGDTTYYTISNTGEYEVGQGVYTTGTLSRDSIFASSNSDTRLNLSIESDVFITYPSLRSVHICDSGNITGINAIDFDLITNPGYQEGRVFYDNVNHALSVYNDEADIALQVGQEEYVRARNNTGGTITNGQAVRILGSQGTSLTIELAIATGSFQSQIIGLATHDIETNSFGYITSFGVVNDVDTSAFNDGDEVFLSPVISGGLTGVAPNAPFFKSSVGHVIRSHPSVGTVLVSPRSEKLGGPDIKSSNGNNMIASGVTFVELLTGEGAAVLASNDGMVYSSGTKVLSLNTVIVEGASGNLQEWKDPVGSGAYIDNDGNFVFRSYSDATRPAAGVAGRVIFNTDDGNLNIDNGGNWIHPSGGTT